VLSDFFWGGGGGGELPHKLAGLGDSIWKHGSQEEGERNKTNQVQTNDTVNKFVIYTLQINATVSTANSNLYSS
jgi:hypothetical protein